MASSAFLLTAASIFFSAGAAAMGVSAAVSATGFFSGTVGMVVPVLRLPNMAGKTETLSPAIPEDVEDDVYRLLKAICDAELKLVTAESCTGGLLASLLTDVEGCGHAFERGFVTYTDAAKSEMLGVDAI